MLCLKTVIIVCYQKNQHQISIFTPPSSILQETLGITQATYFKWIGLSFSKWQFKDTLQSSDQAGQKVILSPTARFCHLAGEAVA